ncbi:MAG: GNAT family N-acetyltransferase [Anaerolineales bacterium]|nr:GNAT family N-acetyltransferase [Anaerolineales bacterium]
MKLLSSAGWLHQHLDWIDPANMLGEVPFLVASRRGQTVGCLACPPELPDSAWIRLFATSKDLPASRLWDPLWDQAARQASSIGVTHVAVLISVDWFAALLEKSGFEHTNEVVFLQWQRESLPNVDIEKGKIRRMRQGDLAEITAIDQHAFGRIWQYSLKTMRQAFRKAALATLLEIEGNIVAYQISTTSYYGAHLARLAVAPEWQGAGFGKALVVDALRKLAIAGNQGMSVNTQLDNERSLHLYRQLGFAQTGARHPIYEIKLHP